MMTLLKRSKRSIKNCKKASIVDQLLLIVFAILIIAITMAFYIGYKEINDALQDNLKTYDESSEQFESINRSAETIKRNSERYPNFWDPLLVFVIFGVWLSILITSFILGNNPIFLVMYLITSFGSLITGVAIKVTLVNMLYNPGIIEFSQHFPITLWVANNYIGITIMFIMTIGGVLYAKRSK